MKLATALGIVGVALALAGCAAGGSGGDGGAQDMADASSVVDADPNAPDADPNAPDASPGAPDARPGAVDAAPPPDAPPVIAECTNGGGECGVGRGCLEGICRDECLLGVWCGEASTGEYCHNGLCVACQSDDDCPGTRYTCDPTSRTCVDKPGIDPTVTKIGVFYHTWHCISNPVYDLTEILAGNASYGPYNASHWWGRPVDGYYCLTENEGLLRKHAEQLRDMGADFVFVDVTNHAYNSNALNDRPVEMIIQPFTRMVEVWSTVAGAPRIVPWVPIVVTDGSHPTSTHMVYTLLDILATRPGMQFVYDGKPLIIITENDGYPVDESKVSALSANYTLRKMWAGEPDGTAKWSYKEFCDHSPLDASKCFQRSAIRNGQIEQVSIAMAYQADYMSHMDSAVPKYQGKTFRKQFETLLDNPEVPIATITGWNEWTVGRLQCDQAPLCHCSSPQDQNGCFLDQYNMEYSRDIEPADNAMGDYYYRLVKACIGLFRAGGRCDAANAGNLCCKDYPG